MLAFHLSYSDPGKVLSSKRLTEQQKQDTRYGEGNLPNASYMILGTLDAFDLPPVTEYALQNLNYIQAFNIFHYKAPSFTERRNYPSFLIAYTYDGKASLTYRGKKFFLSKGDVFFINCMQEHRYEVPKGQWDAAILHVWGPQREALQNQYRQGGYAVFHESAEGTFQQYLEQALELYSTPQLYRDWQVSSYLKCLTSSHTILLIWNLLPLSNRNPLSSNSPLIFQNCYYQQYYRCPTFVLYVCTYPENYLP